MACDHLDYLLVKISTGDNSAFEQFYTLTVKGAYVFAYSYFKEKTLAEDITHDAYVQVKLKAHTYKQGSNAKAWFLQIVKNLCLDELRKRKRTQMNMADEKQLETAVYSPFEQGGTMEHMLKTLTEEERNIVVLHVFWGYKHKEIAVQLGIPLGTVLWRYNVAIKKLKTYKEEA